MCALHTWAGRHRCAAQLQTRLLLWLVIGASLVIASCLPNVCTCVSDTEFLIPTLWPTSSPHLSKDQQPTAYIQSCFHIMARTSAVQPLRVAFLV